MTIKSYLKIHVIFYNQITTWHILNIMPQQESLDLGLTPYIFIFQPHIQYFV